MVELEEPSTDIRASSFCLPLPSILLLQDPEAKTETTGLLLLAQVQPALSAQDLRSTVHWESRRTTHTLHRYVTTIATKG